MYKYAVGQLKSNKMIKIMVALVLSILAVIFSMSLFLSSAVFNFIAPRFYNPNAKIDVKISATGGTNFISESILNDYSENIEKITPTVDLYGLIGQKDSSTIISIRGVNSKNVFFDEDYQVVAGTMVFQADQCVLPIALAESLNAKVGDSVTLECNKKTISAAIVGIYKGFKIVADVQTIFVSDRTASFFMYNSYSEGLYNTLNVQLKPTIKGQDFVELLKKSENASVMNIVLAKDVNQLQTALSMAKIPTAACMIMLIFLVAVIVFALYYLDGVKQQKLISVFRNAGASTKQIVSVFLGSHLIIGLIGGAIGAVLSCIVTLAITTVVGISVNIIGVAALGFLILQLSNGIVSLASIAVSLRPKKTVKASRTRGAMANAVLLAIIAVGTLLFILMAVNSRQILALGKIKDVVAIISLCLMLATVYAFISLAYDMYKRLHIKLLSRSSSVGLWLASAGALKGKQTKNFFVILTTLIVVMVTTTSILYFLQNTANKPINNQNDTVLYCGNIQDKSRDKIEKTFSDYDSTVLWSGKESISFATEENISAYASILDKNIIESLCVFNNPLSAAQLAYFASDNIGIYYSDSRQTILKEKVGTTKTIITKQGNKELPFLGHIKEASYAMTDILINRATAEYLGVNNNIAYVIINSVDIDKVLSDTKSELFGYGIILEKQSALEQKEKDANRPMANMFAVVNYCVVVLLFFVLAFYVILISNYQKENFAKLNAVGMCNKALFSSQVSVILPISILSMIVGVAVSQGVRYCYNTIFSYVAVGTVRVYSNYVFYALPAVVIVVGMLIYLLSHYQVIRTKCSLRTDIER